MYRSRSVWILCHDDIITNDAIGSVSLGGEQSTERRPPAESVRAAAEAHQLAVALHSALTIYR